MALVNVSIPQTVVPIADAGGLVQQIWRRFFETISSSIAASNAALSVVVGVNRFTVATQPTLGAGDAGYVGYLTDYAHLIWWDGANWQFMDGDRPGRFVFSAVSPGVGYQLCDGTVTKYVTLAGTITETSFTTPNLSASPSYLKAGAYTGALNAKSGSTAGGTTGAGSAHTHTYSGNTGLVAGSQITSVAGANLWANTNSVHDHTINGTTDAESAHTHSVPALGVGSVDMENLAAPVYFRR